MDRFSDSVLWAAVDAVLVGGSRADAAALVGCHPRTLARFMDRVGVDPRKRFLDAVDVAVEAFYRGGSVRACARQAGISAEALKNRLDVLGVAHPKIDGQGVRVPDSVIGSALRAYWGGVSLQQAADEAGVSARTLSRRLADHCVAVSEPKPAETCLSLGDREEIRVGIERNESATVIAARIGCHRSTVWREIKANGGRVGYRIVPAHERAGRVAKRPKPGWTQTRPELWVEVQRLLREQKWSPEQITKRLRREHGDEPKWCVSAESVYQAIYVQTRGELQRELIRCLRQAKPRRTPQRRAVTVGSKIKDMVNISERPPETSDRAFPGSWEGDLIIGLNNKSAVATLIERNTRYGLLIKLDNKTAPHVAQRISEAFSGLPASMRKALTWDQGTELAAHATITTATDMAVYFCDPHSPWQRPSNENFNGLARQFLPKHTDLTIHTQQDLDHIADLLNGRPRKILLWDTPTERFEQFVATTT